MGNLEKMRLALADLKADYERRYGYALFQLDVQPLNGGCLLSGRVLIDAQKSKALDLAHEIVGDIVEDRIEVLDNLDGPSPHGWASAKTLADVWRYLPESSAARLNNKNSNLSSQLAEDDNPVKLLCKQADYWLVQLVDGVIGWVAEGDLGALDLKADESWPGVRRPLLGSSLDVPECFGDLEDAALAYLGVPYLWGGTTTGGIDCSGFVQRAYMRGLGVVLPKHSREQLRVGKRVSKRDALPGDLIFFTVEGNVMHVGIMLDENRVIHASRVEHKVVVEPLEIALGNRRFAGARRIVHFRDVRDQRIQYGEDARVPNG